MGSIPLPALHVAVPQPQDNLLEQYARIQQIKAQQANQPLIQQELQQRVQAGQLQNQQSQREMDSQNAIMSAWSASNGDLGKAYEAAAKSGKALPQDLAKIRDAHVAMQKQALELVKQQGDLAVQHAGLQADAANAVMDAPPEARPAVYQAKLQQLAQSGIDVSQAPQQYPGDQAFNVYRLGFQSHANAVSEAKQKIENEKNVAETGKFNAQTAEAQTNAALNPQKFANEQAYRQSELKQGQQRISIEGARLKFDQARQGTQDQQAIEAQAQQIASGEVKGLSQARNNPFARAVMARVYEINPQYADSLYTATQDLRSSKPNSMGGNVGRLGTAILHADEALSHSKDLGFSEGLLTGVGTSGTAAYKQAAEFLTGEIGQYVTGGKLTVDEGKKLSSDLMSSRQGVRDSALHEIITLSKGKLQSQMGQFTNATQKEFPTDRVFNDPAIKSALEKHGVIGSGASAQGSTGNNAGGKVYYKIVNGQLVAQ